MIPHRSPTVDPTKILTRQELRLVLADLKRQAQRSKQGHLNLILFRHAYLTGWACALRPAALADYKAAIGLAQHAFNMAVESEALGTILFRAGRYEEALRHLQGANASGGASPARIAYLLAMTHHRLGHAADARMWLERGNEEAEKERNNKSRPQAWDERLILELFQREATQLIGTKAPDRR